MDLPDSGTQYYRLELASVSGGISGGFSGGISGGFSGGISGGFTLDHPPALYCLEGESGNKAESAFC